MSHSEPSELTFAKQLIEEYKLVEAERLMKNFEEKGGHTLYDIVLCHHLKCLLLFRGGLYEDVFKLIEQTYEESLELGKNLLSVDILLTKANVLIFLVQSDKAHEIIKQGEKLLKALDQELPKDYKRRKAYIAFLKGWFYVQIGDADRALKHAEHSLALREELGIKHEIVLTLVGISYIFSLLKSNLDSALKYSERAMAVAEESGNKWCKGYCLSTMAYIHRNKGEFDRSIKLFEQSLTIFNDLNNKPWIARVYKSLGAVYSMRGELDRSIRFYEQSLELNKELNDKTVIADNLNNLSVDYMMRGELDLALNCIEQALALNHELGRFLGLVFNYDYLIQILIDKGDLPRAHQSLNELEQLINQSKDTVVKLIYLLDKALVLKTTLRAPSRGEAEVILKQILNEAGDEYEISIVALLNLCELLLTEFRMTNDLEVLDEIKPFITQLLDLSDKSHSFWVLGETYLLQAKIALISLNLEEARKLLTQGQQIAEKYGLKLLANKISNEHDELLKQLRTWENLKESNAPLNQRIKIAGLKEQIENMARKRATKVSSPSDEKPVFLFIVSEGGNPIFSQSFVQNQDFEDHLFGGFFTAINSFINEKFAEGLDRAIFGEHTLLMNSVSPFFVCYIFKGQSYSAQQRVGVFIDRMQNDKDIWQAFEKYYQTNQEIQINNIPSLEPLIKEIFIDRTILLTK
ncbi:MAG: tetratricopeptide repeat protein [Promethearchaeota archaeon]